MTLVEGHRGQGPELAYEPRVGDGVGWSRVLLRDLSARRVLRVSRRADWRRCCGGHGGSVEMTALSGGRGVLEGLVGTSPASLPPPAHRGCAGTSPASLPPRAHRGCAGTSPASLPPPTHRGCAGTSPASLPPPTHRGCAGTHIGTTTGTTTGTTYHNSHNSRKLLLPVRGQAFPTTLPTAIV